MSIKLKYLRLAHRKHPDQAQLWMAAGRKKLTPPLEADGNQEMFDFTPSPFSIKEAWILGFPGGAVVENLPANAGDTGSSAGPGRSHMPRNN